MVFTKSKPRNTISISRIKAGTKMSVTAETISPDAFPPFTESGYHSPPKLSLVPTTKLFYPILENPLETRATHIEGTIAGGTAKVFGTLEEPLDTKASENLPTIVIFHGLFGVESAYDGLRNELAKRGYPTLTTTPFRGEGRFPALNPKNTISPVRSASRAVLGLIREVQFLTGREEYEALTHSNGTQPGLDLASHERLNVIRNVVIMAGNGLEKASLLQMASRVPKFGSKDLPLQKYCFDPKFVKQEARYALTDGFLTVTDILSAGSCKNIKRTDKVRAIEKKVGFIAFEEDDLIKAAAIRRQASHFDVLHIFRNPSARHRAPQDYPSDVAEAYLETLREMLTPKLEVVTAID
jgi:hypothetical protein